MFKRTVRLPSGRKIEVVYFEKPDVGPEPLDDLTICPDCDSRLVYPVSWEEAGHAGWEVELRCPACEWTETGVHDQATVNRFDDALDMHTESVVREARRCEAENMAEEVERFALALSKDLILPEDF